MTCTQPKNTSDNDALSNAVKCMLVFCEMYSGYAVIMRSLLAVLLAIVWKEEYPVCIFLIQMTEH